MLEKIAAQFGACPIQYKLLLQTEKTVEERALEGKQGTAKLSLSVTCAFCFLTSIFSALPVFFGMDVFTYALIGVTMSMFIVGMWTLPYFDLLLSPINYPVVAHTPVSSRTYFLVKLTQILKYAVLLLTCLNIFPSICGPFIREDNTTILCYFFPVFYLPIAFMAGFFTIGVMTAFAGYLTKLYSVKRLRKISKSAQFILPLLVPVSFFLIPTDVIMDNYKSVLKWLYVFPNGWFAGGVSLAVSTIERPGFTRDLILTGAAIFSTLLLVLIPLRSIAKTYSKYLSFLMESGSRQKDKLRIRRPLLARFFRSRDAYASFCLSSAYMRRDRQLLHQFVSGAVVSVMMIAMFFVRDIYPIEFIEYHYAIGLSPGFTGLFVFLGVVTVFGFLSSVGYSEHWKASWMLSLVPLRKPYDLWRGVVTVTFIYIVFPCTLLFSILATFLWGVMGIFFVLPGLLVVLFSVITYPKPESGIPLSKEPVEIDRMAGCLAYGISMIIAGVLVGILFLARFIHVWVYIAVYSIIVVGGLIGFIKFYKKESMKDTSDA
ncbi:MAG: hypothetical protein OXM61_08060 [Candidatus Poribacteria bacterium]|nr:hypothetical protein [Candidatus Poribacteria bacterium]